MATQLTLAPHDMPATDLFVLIHDRDNTLVNEDVTFHAYEALLKEQGVLVPAQTLAATYAGKRFEQVFKYFETTYDITIGDPAIANERLRYTAAYEAAVHAVQTDHLRTLPGVRGALILLKAAGVPMAIATNNTANVCARGHALLGLDHFIPDNRVFAGDRIWENYPEAKLEELTTGEKGFKPAPDLYQMALQGVPPEQAIAIDDSIAGIRAAKAAGIGTIVLARAGIAEDRKASHTQQALDAGATHVIDDYAQLLSIVVEKAPKPIADSLEQVVRNISAVKRGRGRDSYENAVRVVEGNNGVIPLRRFREIA